MPSRKSSNLALRNYAIWLSEPYPLIQLGHFGLIVFLRSYCQSVRLRGHLLQRVHALGKLLSTNDRVVSHAKLVRNFTSRSLLVVLPAILGGSIICRILIPAMLPRLVHLADHVRALLMRDHCVVILTTCGYCLKYSTYIYVFNPYPQPPILLPPRLWSLFSYRYILMILTNQSIHGQRCRHA